MKKITRLSGVRVNAGNGFSKVSVSEDDLAIASLPGLLMWLQAGSDYISPLDYSIFDRANGVRLNPLAATDPVSLPALGVFDNGAPAFNFPVTGTQPYKAINEGDIQLNPDEWSFVMVLHPVSGDTPDEIIGPYGTPTDVDDIHVRFGISSSGKYNLWTGATSTRLSTDSADNHDKDQIVAVTFSTDLGIKILINGVVAASDPTDVRPLNGLSFKLGSNGNTTNIFGGLMGHVLAFNQDISREEYTGYKENMERILKAKYGIL